MSATEPGTADNRVAEHDPGAANHGPRREGRNAAEHEIAAGEKSEGRPTAILRMADAGDLFMSWRWEDDIAAPGVAAVPAGPVEEAVARLTRALPDPAVPDGLAFALTEGDFARGEMEYELVRELSRALLPEVLVQQLVAFARHGVRPLLRVQPSPRVAQVPWEILAPAPTVPSPR